MIYRYSFRTDVEFPDVEATLLLALWSLESLYGESAVRLESPHQTDEVARTVEVEGSTPIGAALNRLLVGLLAREFGSASFRVERLDERPRRSTHDR
ncbi:MAG: hypothetical protein KF847_20445 [Pirellulales bacterium]|nr:hypothetical protein [Pirellulales bacterium]